MNVFSHVYVKLCPKDKLTLSTLSKELRRMYTVSDPFQPITLATEDQHVSFARWIQTYGMDVSDLDVTTHIPSSLLSFVAGVCRSLTTIRLNLPELDTMAIRFMAHRLRHMTMHLNHDTYMDTISFPSLESFHVLHGRSKRLTLPSSLPSLHTLGLHMCTIFDFPNDMPRLRALEVPRSLHVHNISALLTIPTTLTRLDMSRNNMTFVPYGVGRFVHLKDLDVCYNQMMTYDDVGMYVDDTISEIEGLTALTRLNVSHNLFDTMGLECLQRLTCRLKVLDISCTPCVDIPFAECLGGLTSLKTSVIPSCLGRLTMLEEIKLHGHCDRYVPFDEEWPDLTSVRIPSSLDTMSIDDDDRVNTRLVYTMCDMIKKSPSIRCRH
jgi:hypothetical protein